MLVIGIAGGTGSGKTTVVNEIVKQLKDTEITIISQDSYYRDNSNITFEEREKINYDHPKSIDFELLVQHLKDLKEGKSIEQPVYSYTDHNRTGETTLTKPTKIIIIEGILVFTSRELLSLFDMKLFIYADSDERLIRRLKRDVAERGRDVQEVLTRYQTTLKPMHKQFIEPTMQEADLIIPNMNFNNVAVQVIRTVIKDKLSQSEN